MTKTQCESKTTALRPLYNPPRLWKTARPAISTLAPDIF